MDFFFFGMMLFLSMALLAYGAEVDWRDEIPEAGDFLDALLLSRLVYRVQPETSAESWTELGFTPLFFMDFGSSTEFGVAFKDRKLFMVFRGSDDMEDFRENLDIDFVAYNPPNLAFTPDSKPTTISGSVHNGFYQKLFANDGLMANIQMLCQDYVPDYEVILTGHSQGGAMASLLGAWMAQWMPDQKFTVLNFGSPRLADTDWKNSIRQKLTNLAIYRFVYEEDSVARLPWYSQGFRHVGHLLYKFEHDDRYIKAYFQQSGGGQYIGISDAKWEIDVDILDPGDSISDHLGENYESAIKAALINSKYWPSTFETKNVPSCCFKLFGRCWRSC